MKKAVCIALAAVLLSFAFVGCGSSSTQQAGATVSNASSGSSAVASSTPASTAPASTVPASTQPLIKLRVGYMPNFSADAPFVTAQQMGYFKEQGLEVEFVKFESGPPMVAAMVSGDVNVGQIGQGAHFLAAQGQAKIIGIDNTGNSDELLARKDKITSVKDLKGKTVAAQFGTSSETILNLALKQAGLAKTDVKIVNMDMAGATSAFIADKVDAACVWSPSTTQIKKSVGEDKVIMLANDATFKDSFVFPSSFVTTPAYLSSNEDNVVRFMKAVMKGMDYRKDHLDEVAQWVSEFDNTPLDLVKAEVPLATWFTSSDNKQLFSDGTAKKWYEGLEQLFVDSGKLKSTVPAEDFVAFDTINKVFAQ